MSPAYIYTVRTQIFLIYFKLTKEKSWLGCCCYSLWNARCSLWPLGALRCCRSFLWLVKWDGTKRRCSHVTYQRSWRDHQCHNLRVHLTWSHCLRFRPQNLGRPPDAYVLLFHQRPPHLGKELCIRVAFSICQCIHTASLLCTGLMVIDVLLPNKGTLFGNILLPVSSWVSLSYVKCTQWQLV
jgi:hypothetical protein